MISYYFAQFIQVFFEILDFAIIARILMSWFPANSGGQIRQFLYNVTEPVLAPFRRIIPRIGMIDISPIAAIIVLDLVKMVLIYILGYS